MLFAGTQCVRFHFRCEMRVMKAPRLPLPLPPSPFFFRTMNATRNRFSPKIGRIGRLATRIHQITYTRTATNGRRSARRRTKRETDKGRKKKHQKNGESMWPDRAAVGTISSVGFLTMFGFGMCLASLVAGHERPGRYMPAPRIDGRPWDRDIRVNGMATEGRARNKRKKRG